MGRIATSMGVLAIGIFVLMAMGGAALHGERSLHLLAIGVVVCFVAGRMSKGEGSL